jgi:hypothetical protein
MTFAPPPPPHRDPVAQSAPARATLCHTHQSPSRLGSCHAHFSLPTPLPRWPPLPSQHPSTPGFGHGAPHGTVPWCAGEAKRASEAAAHRRIERRARIGDLHRLDSRGFQSWQVSHKVAYFGRSNCSTMPACTFATLGSGNESGPVSPVAKFFSKRTTMGGNVPRNLMTLATNLRPVA